MKEPFLYYIYWRTYSLTLSTKVNVFISTFVGDSVSEAIGHGSCRARQWRIGTDPKRKYVSKASEFLTEREHEIRQARLPSPHQTALQALFGSVNGCRDLRDLAFNTRRLSQALASSPVQSRLLHPPLGFSRVRLHRLRHDRAQIRLPRGLLLLPPSGEPSSPVQEFHGSLQSHRRLQRVFSRVSERKILERSGLGEETYLPEGLHCIPPRTTMVAAREEAEQVMFGCLDKLFENTKINPRDIGVFGR